MPVNRIRIKLNKVEAQSVKHIYVRIEMGLSYHFVLNYLKPQGHTFELLHWLICMTCASQQEKLSQYWDYSLTEVVWIKSNNIDFAFSQCHRVEDLL